MRIFLVGFMGSGKSYTGKKLAAELGYGFIDMDERIEEIEKTTVAQIFTEYGEAHFRQMEHNHLLEIVHEDNVVVSTGGGAPCFHGNMDLMMKHGIAVYLETPTELLFQRLKHQVAKRPLLANRNESDVKQFITHKIEERLPYYGKAQIVLRQDENGDKILRELLAVLKKQ